MRRRERQSLDDRRRRIQRIEAPRILIVCEGERTETLYFEGFRNRNVEVHGTGFNTVTLVKEAARLSLGKAFAQVWCVFDKDSFPPADFQKAIDLARKYGFHAAYTNEAFELWYLLHFDYHTSALSRTQYGEKLTERLQLKYEKNDPTVFARLLPHLDNAIRNAEKLFASYNPHVPHQDNPCTTVHLLVQELSQSRS